MWLKSDKLNQDISFIKENKLEHILSEKGYVFYYTQKYQQFSIEVRTSSHIVKIVHTTKKTKDNKNKGAADTKIYVLFRNTIQMKKISKKVLGRFYVKESSEWSDIVGNLIKDIGEIRESRMEDDSFDEESSLAK